MSEVRVRFAPSPTGYVHIGGLRTALYNYLFARNKKGKFILRIEDTDRTRLVDGALENLINVMNWAGLEYDEGVYVEDGKIVEKGEFGPYIQSDRVDAGIYDKYIDQLIEEGKAYYCFCSQDRIDNLREQQKADGLMPKYDGLCRGLTTEDAKERIANGEKYVVRLKLPANKDIEFDDLIKGKISINTNDMDDQVLIKSDGFPTYHFAVVVDDHMMGITHVVRGDEWISSTPKHVYLYEAFGWQAPTYVHLPTVLGEDGKKLSKRKADVAVEDFVQKGYIKDALINYIALVGWSPATNEEILSKEDLIEQFTFDRVSKTGGTFDVKKLDWVNGHYLRELDDQEIAKEIKPFLVNAGYVEEDVTEEYMLKLAETFKTAIDKYSEVVEEAKLLFKNVADEDFFEEEAKEALKAEESKTVLKAFKKEIEENGIDDEIAQTIMKTVQKASGIKGKPLWFAVRSALTGAVHGPDLKNTFVLLGKDEILNRVNYVLENF